MPCAVCQAPRSVSLLLPADTECPIGWITEFSGYMMASKKNEKRAEYVCVDESPSYIKGRPNAGDADGVSASFLFLVEGRCNAENVVGGLPCPPTTSVLLKDKQHKEEMTQEENVYMEVIAGEEIQSTEKGIGKCQYSDVDAVPPGKQVVVVQKQHHVSLGIAVACVILVCIVVAVFSIMTIQSHNENIRSQTKGVMSGAPHNDNGSGTNYLCLPDQPRYKFTMAGYQITRGSITAVEFRESQKDFKPTKDLHGVNFPCAVCQAPRSVSLLLPADTKCPIGWITEFSGYMMASRKDETRAEYVCVDKSPSYIKGSDKPDGDADWEMASRLFLVEGRCNAEAAVGGLPCPPYVDGYELTCAICTQ
ncbi:uncharacterized protein [Antedon mediterranea]|uniref:uncharacterized protein isoform X2 n=1 Tax=Antedon mediterranea TaxID=105859 RepID=UPI003AF75101